MNNVIAFPSPKPHDGVPPHPGPRPDGGDDLAAWQSRYDEWYDAMLARLADELIYSGGKTPKPLDNVANAVAMLTCHPELYNLFALNRFSHQLWQLSPLPASDEAATPAAFTPHEVSDSDVTMLQTWLQRHGLPKVSKDATWSALGAVARAASFDPLWDFVERCKKAWDGTHRIHRLFDDYFVAEAQTAYTEWLGTASMVTLVLRAFDPGAFQKMVPILEGPQDIGKSSGLLALCPDALWFGGDPPDRLDREAKTYLRGLWIVELAELSAMRKAEIEGLKAFITTQRDRFRAAYARGEITVERRCMFWGTTNDDDYLKDATGNTRFYPVKLKAVDLEAIRRDRDQLIGEAAVYLREAQRDSEEWWKPPAEVASIIAREREARQDVDPWTEAVAKFVHDLDEVCPGMILCGWWEPAPEGDEEAKAGLKAKRKKRGLDFDRAQLSPRETRRISNILRQLGWVKSGKMPHDHEYPRAARFVPGPEAGTIGGAIA